jgi:hypothetical protein
MGEPSQNAFFSETRGLANRGSSGGGAFYNPSPSPCRYSGGGEMLKDLFGIAAF